MKRGKTRKNTNVYNMSGGLVPYAANAYNSAVLSKLVEFTAEIRNLSILADTYRTKTENLNNPTAMTEHLTAANQIQAKALAAYNKAQAFWSSVYGSTWVPPPSPAPAPPV